MRDTHVSVRAFESIQSVRGCLRLCDGVQVCVRACERIQERSRACESLKGHARKCKDVQPCVKAYECV